MNGEWAFKTNTNIEIDNIFKTGVFKNFGFFIRLGVSRGENSGAAVKKVCKNIVKFSFLSLQSVPLCVN